MVSSMSPEREGELRELGRQLYEAERARQAVPQVSAGRPWLGPAEAYRVQQEVVRRRMATGETIVGWKIGLTSEAMRRQLNVDQPDYGPILSGYMVAPGTAIPVGELIQPRIEAEIAFVLRAPLRGPGVTAADVLASTEGVAAALEIIDSRIEAWKLTLPDTIADLASSARVTWSGRLVPLDGLDLKAIRVVLERGGEVVGEGLGSAVLGDPAEAVAWAANTLGGLGVTMEAGQLIMPGALHASVWAHAGDVFEARFDHLGAVTARFA
jgi:2-keto-4-pentenoate hydratase